MDKKKNIGKKNRLMQYGVLIVALIMIVSSGVYATIYITSDGIYDSDYNNRYLNYKEFDFIISTDGTRNYVYNSSSGRYVYSNNNFTSCFDYCMNKVSSGTAFKNYSSIFIGTGDYTIPSTLIIDKHSVRVSGVSLSHNYGPTRLVLSDGVNDDVIRITGNYAKITDLMINGNKDDNTAGKGIETGVSVGFLIRDVVVSNCADDGIDGSGGDEVVFDNVLVKSNNGSGIDMDNGAKIINCEFSGNGKYGYEGSGCMIVNSNFEFNLEGARIVHNTLISNCKFIGNTERQIYAVGNNNIVDGNIIDCSSETDYGIYVHATSTNVTISDNGIYGFIIGKVSDSGVRTLINGLGKNSGDPNSGGDWDGYGEFGVSVVDVTSGTFYRYNSSSWIALN